MTHDPTLSPERVAELEKKLADAAAEVARVQAELAAVQAASGPQVPHVPYGGTVSAPPVITVNGQVVDLATHLPQDVADQVRTSLAQLGLDGQLGGLFGGGSEAAPLPEPTSVARLAEPPRAVPFVFRLATFNLSGYELFWLTMGLVSPLALWIFVPGALTVALVAAVLVVAWFRIRRYVRRTAILKWGKVATVTNRDLLSRGTYYSGMTYHNMRMRQAHGWDATTTWYSGPGSKTQIAYSLDGTSGTLELRGMPYANGVILADSRKPTRAMCVSEFPYSVKPGPDGQFDGTLTTWLWGGIFATLLIEGTLVYLAVLAVLDTWVSR